MGIPTEILWEWDGNGNENSLPTATLNYVYSATSISGVSIRALVDRKKIDRDLDPDHHLKMFRRSRSHRLTNALLSI